MFSLHMKDIFLKLNFYFMLLLSRSYPHPNPNSNPKFGFLLVFSSKMVEMNEKFAVKNGLVRHVRQHSPLSRTLLTL